MNAVVVDAAVVPVSPENENIQQDTVFNQI